MHTQTVFTLKFITVAPTSSIWAYDSHRVQKKLCQSKKNTLDPSDSESRTNILVLRINMSIPAFFPLGTHCTWRLDEPTNVCLIYRVLKHYKQYSRTYQHENLASVDFKGIFVTLVMYQASCFTGVSEWQNTGSRVLAPKMLTGMVQTRRTSDPEESSQCCDDSMDRVEEVWVWVAVMERWGPPVLTAEGRKAP